MGMKFTIITVCYNAEKKIRTTMDSILCQTHENMECIVIDGASTDGTLGILAGYSGCRRLTVFSERDYGIYNAMNRGIARASGDYVIFVNAGDSLYDENVLSRLCRIMNPEEKTIYYGKVCRIGNTRGADRIKDFSAIASSPVQGFLKREMPCHQGIAAPLGSLRNFYFKEEFRYCADFDWLIRCCQSGYRLADTGCLISRYDNTGVTSGTVGRKRMRREAEAILKRHFPIRYRLHSAADGFRQMMKEPK